MGPCEILPPDATVLREKCSPQNNAPVLQELIMVEKISPLGEPSYPVKGSH